MKETKLSNPSALLLLERIELKKRSLVKNSTTIDENLTLEHIMPIRYSDEDYPKYKDFTKEQRNKLIGTLGNMTIDIAANNSSKGNKSAKEKIEKYDLSFILNQELKKNYDAEEWNEGKIQKRSSDLAKFVLEHWKYPSL